MRNITKYYRINYQITALQMRLLDETGKQIGILSKNDALRRAQMEKKDLVEIAAKANPPVVKLIDFKKFKYLEAKKERESKKNTKTGKKKEVRLSPFIGEHDFQIRMMQAENFLKEGNQLKISLPFRGRQMAHTEIGRQVLDKAINYLNKVAKIVKAPYMEGRVLVSILVPLKITKSTENAKSEN